MLSQYVPIIVMIVFAIVMAAVFPLVSYLFGPRRPSPVKSDTYECGIPGMIGDSRSRFDIKFAKVALMSLLFYIEFVFIVPWAVVFDQLGLLGLVEMMTFVLILLVALAYIWRKGVFNWE